MASSKFSRNMSASRQNVHLLLVACSVFMLLMLSSMLPQTRAVLSGTGGVFNSPEAQEYWNRRYKLMIFYFLTLLLQKCHSFSIIDSLNLKFIFFVDLDLVNLMLLAPQQGNLLTKSLLRLPNHFQDSQKYKK